MSSEISALEDLKGRCLFLDIEYPDTGVRMRPAILCITKHLGEAVKRPLLPDEVQELAEELSDLRGYLAEIQKKYPYVKKDFQPTINVCNWLLSLD